VPRPAANPLSPLHEGSFLAFDPPDSRFGLPSPGLTQIQVRCDGLRVRIARTVSLRVASFLSPI
jgi:hypothetical protein